MISKDDITVIKDHVNPIHNVHYLTFLVKGYEVKLNKVLDTGMIDLKIKAGKNRSSFFPEAFSAVCGKLTLKDIFVNFNALPVTGQDLQGTFVEDITVFSEVLVFIVDHYKELLSEV